jgi:hypothetical protein
MSAFIHVAQLVLLIVVSAMTTVSGMVLTRSIEEDYAGTAWMGAVAFVATSFLTDLLFWGGCEDLEKQPRGGLA